MPDRLELRVEADGQRHYLRGRPVVVGDRMDLWLDDGSQIHGRYEWRGEGEPALLVLFLRGGEPVEVTLPSSARLSWPELTRREA